MDNGNEVRNWYNRFSERQRTTGVNLRHYRLCNEIIRAGLRKNSSVLEIGCGVGTLTGLLYRYIKNNGLLVATDISDMSISLARQSLPKSNHLKFIAADIIHFSYPGKFDFIILPDVLEHIPEAHHAQLFQVITSHMHEDSVVIINVPHPKVAEYLQLHHPEQLQIIDLAIHVDALMKDIYSHNLILESYKSYSLFNNAREYVLIILRMNTSVSWKPRTRWQIIRTKMAERVRYAWLTIRH